MTDELKELLKDLAEYMDSKADADHDGENYQPNKEMKFKERIEEVEADAAPDGWIRVEDRLPGEDEWVLLYNGFWTGVGKYNKHEDDDDYEPEWMDETMAYIHDIPTHWQPLPPPPKKKV